MQGCWFPSHSHLIPLQKSGGSWQSERDYHPLNQVIAPVSANVPYVVSLLEQINTTLGIRYVTVNGRNCLFPYPLRRRIRGSVHLHEVGNSIQSQFCSGIVHKACPSATLIFLTI